MPFRSHRADKACDARRLHSAPASLLSSRANPPHGDASTSDPLAPIHTGTPPEGGGNRQPVCDENQPFL
jgi:hypothetical protein